MSTAPAARVCRLLAVLVAGCAVLSAARAETYPLRPVRLIVPWVAGGVADITARAVAEDMRAMLGQAVVVDNRPGASGKIGTEAVARAAPDGYTLLLGSPSGLTLPTVVEVKPGFDPVRDFKPILQLSSSTYFLVVNRDLPVRTTAELIAYARAHPGMLNYGSWGTGTATHLAGAMLANAARIDIVHVPYKGEAPVVQDLIAGQVQLAFLIDAKSRVEANQLRALGTTASEPWFTLPEIPPIGQTALPGFKFLAWQGLLAPADTPDDIVAVLSRAANQAVASGRTRSVLIESGFKPVGGAPEQLGRTIAEDLASMRRVVTEAKLKFDN